MSRDRRDSAASQARRKQPPTSGGERSNDRDVIDRMTKRMMGSGVPAGDAVKAARQSMTRVDRQMRDEGRR